MSRVPEFFCAGAGRAGLRGERDFRDAAGDDQLPADVDFQVKAGVDAAKLEKAAAQGAARQTRRGEFGEKTASPNQDFPSFPRDHGDLVGAVFGTNNKLVHVPHGFKL